MPATNPAAKPKTPLIDDETKALFELGFIVPLDIVFFCLECLIGFGSLVWIIASKPDFVYILAVVMLMQLLLAVWTITVCYRSCYFTLKMRSVMEMLPIEAGKIAFQIHEAKVGSVTKPGETIKTMPPGI